MGCCPASILTASKSPAAIRAWWPNAGLILPVTLAHHPGLGELVNRDADRGGSPGRANAGDNLTGPQRWTNDFGNANRHRKDYYYLPHIMMHELGHIAGLGHAHDGNVMGGVDPNNYQPLTGPTGYDLDGMKHIYHNHSRHN